MSKFLKLPDNLKSWRINSLVSSENGNELYKASKKDYDGTIINANLRHISAYGNAYEKENVEFLIEEAEFLKTISTASNSFNYIEIAYINNSTKEKLDIYIITEDLKSLADELSVKKYTDNDIVDFGIQMSALLETLEAKNIFHGNICPANIFVTNDNKYKLGGFSDFESKITGMDFVAPEIAKKQPPDFTTDIYSLGLIMYCMCNSGVLPFANDGTDIKAATEKRIDGAQITAPENGNQKLKSVIVIACQPENENRWKNAGNIKNALISIQDELPKTTVEKTESNANVIPAESTDFDGNVFEEYNYEEFADEEPENTETADNKAVEAVAAGAALAGAAAVAAGAALAGAAAVAAETANIASDSAVANAENNDEADESGFEVAEVTDIEPAENADNEAKVDTADNSETKTEAETSEPVEAEEKTSVASALEDADNFDVPAGNKARPEPKVIETAPQPIEEDVFDNFEVDKNSVTKPEESHNDYGDFFEEEAPASVKTTDEETNFDVEHTSENKPVEEDSSFDSDIYDDDTKPAKKKRNVAVIVGSVVVMVAAIGFIAFCIISGINKNNEIAATATTAETTEATTQEPTTTAPATTQPTTVKSNSKEVTAVVGYGYSYAKSLLEEQGFTVEIGNYKYSTLYDEGYVISQTPEGNATAENGTVVYLDVSLGAEQVSTTQAPTSAASQAETKAASSTQTKTDDSYIFANSDSTYLSKSDVSSLSRNELNLALNEIYARRGRIFKDSTLSDYFNSKSWYTPKYTSDEFSKNVTFNKYEQSNLNLIIDEQKDKGYR